MKLRFIVAGYGLLASTVYGQETLQVAAYSPEMGNEVVVTASRSPVALKDTLASTTVITEEDIQRTQARNLYQVLKTVPGVNVRRRGGRGANSSVSLRGMGASGTLVLVDGIRIESGTSGDVDIQQIPVDQIERIEIVRGPKSSLYGSSALGGVIQIFTRSGKEDGVRYTAGYGSDNTREGIVTATGSSESSTYSLTLSHVESDGFDNQYSDDDATGEDWLDLDDDSYRKSNLSYRGVATFTDQVDGFVSLVRNEAENDWDGAGAYPSTTTDSTIAAIGTEITLDQYTGKLQYGRFNEEYVSSDRLASWNNGTGKVMRDEALWENTYQMDANNRINFGADYKVEDASYILDWGRYEKSDRDMFSGYLNANSRLGAMTVEGGLRHDDDEVFGSHLTGDAGIAWHFSEQTKLSFTYGEAFKAPSNNDLYYPGYGNPDLLPESSRSIEMGLDTYTEAMMVSFHVFRTKADDLIAYNPVIYGPENINEATIKGAELQLGSNLYTLDVGLNLTYQQPKNDITGADLQLTPRQMASLEVDKVTERWSLGLSWYLQGKQYDNRGDAMPGYGLLGVRGSYQINPQWTVRTRIDNLLDKEYIEVTNYNAEGLFAMVNVDFTPR
ncbi:MAG: TonB-dependent receptor [Pseudomonadota bacterium]|nr:TonB-dependent receptor [Pseudomonadota bacterium]